jgi:hypothetical protein
VLHRGRDLFGDAGDEVGLLQEARLADTFEPAAPSGSPDPPLARFPDLERLDEGHARNAELLRQAEPVGGEQLVMLHHERDGPVFDVGREGRGKSGARGAGPPEIAQRGERSLGQVSPPPRRLGTAPGELGRAVTRVGGRHGAVRSEDARVAEERLPGRRPLREHHPRCASSEYVGTRRHEHQHRCERMR